MNLLETIKQQLTDADITVEDSDIQERIDKMIKFRVPEAEITKSLLTYFGLATKNVVHGDNPVNPIADITSDGTWTSLKIKVVQLWENNHESISQAGIIGDESGTMKFTAWARTGLPLLEEGECYILKNVVSSTFREKMQVSMNKKSKIESIPGDQVTVKDNTITKIGVLISMTPTSGLITRCSTCNKAIRGSCETHPDADGYHDLRIIGNIDNGVSSSTVILNAEVIKSISGFTVDSAMAMATEAMDKEVVGDSLELQLLGKFYYIAGADLGDTILAKSMIPYVQSISDKALEDLIAYINKGE